MNPITDTPLAQYGLPGLVIIILIAGFIWVGKFVRDLLKQHKDERDEWRKSNERQQDESNKNIKENTQILVGLKTLLEIKK